MAGVDDGQADTAVYRAKKKIGEIGTNYIAKVDACRTFYPLQFISGFHVKHLLLVQISRQSLIIIHRKIVLIICMLIIMEKLSNVMKLLSVYETPHTYDGRLQNKL